MPLAPSYNYTVVYDALQAARLSPMPSLPPRSTFEGADGSWPFAPLLDGAAYVLQSRWESLLATVLLATVFAAQVTRFGSKVQRSAWEPLRSLVAERAPLSFALLTAMYMLHFMPSPAQHSSMLLEWGIPCLELQNLAEAGSRRALSALLRSLVGHFLHASDMHLAGNLSVFMSVGVAQEIAMGTRSFAVLISLLTLVTHALVVVMRMLPPPLSTVLVLATGSGGHCDPDDNAPTIGFSAVLFGLIFFYYAVQLAALHRATVDDERPAEKNYIDFLLLGCIMALYYCGPGWAVGLFFGAVYVLQLFSWLRRRFRAAKSWLSGSGSSTEYQ